MTDLPDEQCPARVLDRYVDPAILLHVMVHMQFFLLQEKNRHLFLVYCPWDPALSTCQPVQNILQQVHEAQVFYLHYPPADNKGRQGSQELCTMPQTGVIFQNIVHAWLTEHRLHTT